MPDDNRDRMRNCIKAMLLFWSSDPWTPEMDAQWVELVGNTDCTSKTLCDFGRAVLSEETEA